MTTAQVLSNAIVKPLYRRRRPPPEWGQGEERDERPDRSSFPSGHSIDAAFGFAGAVAPVWPAAGPCAVCGVSAAAAAAERVHSGAHYPTHVAAGVAIAITAAALARSALHCHGEGCCDER
ncbi:phosphatase PAP2 family protein [Streptomyces canus]|uniref:phosphatase PAP2 family protein n=1 Tax=Streptomyces canus TaxID=58343 RepID=UPI003713FD5B